MSEDAKHVGDRADRASDIYPNAAKFDRHPGEKKTGVAESVKILLDKLASSLPFTSVPGKLRGDSLYVCENCLGINRLRAHWMIYLPSS